MWVQGYFNMAKARYSMGPLSVGQLQYDSVMAPTCLVEVDHRETPGRQDPDETTPAVNRETESGPSHTAFRVYRPNSGVRTETQFFYHRCLNIFECYIFFILCQGTTKLFFI